MVKKQNLVRLGRIAALGLAFSAVAASAVIPAESARASTVWYVNPYACGPDQTVRISFDTYVDPWESVQVYYLKNGSYTGEIVYSAHSSGGWVSGSWNTHQRTIDGGEVRASSISSVGMSCG